MKKPTTKAKPLQIGIIAAAFNKEIVEPMITEAIEVIRASGANEREIWRVAGCYEIPVVAETVVEIDTIDAVVVLGYIEKGETLHGEVMGHVVQRSLVETQIRRRKPIGIGIVGPGATLAQAEKRKLECARSAVHAALTNLAVLNSIKREGK